MARNHEHQRVFQYADEAVDKIYQVVLCVDERFGLQSQIRRAAVSVPVNIVEGAQRNSEREFTRCLEISAGSAAEVKYLLQVAERNRLLEKAPDQRIDTLVDEYDKITRMLQLLIQKNRER